MAPTHLDTTRGRLSLALLAAALTGAAATIEGVKFDDTLTVGSQRLDLVGTGLQTYMMFYKVCVAGFYLPPGHAPDKALDDVAKRLEIVYFHRIDADVFAKLTKKGVRANTSARALERMEGDLARLAAAYEDVKPGDRYAITYLPGKGMTLALNGVAKATFTDAAFVPAVFSVWLGREPLSRGLKAALLGKD